MLNTELAGIDINLDSFNPGNAVDGMELFHNNGAGLIPAFLISWIEPGNVAGQYSRLPYIQYLNENGMPYRVKNRPAWLKQYMPVNPLDLLVAPGVDS